MEGKNQKAYVLIALTVSENVSHHIVSINDSYSALNKLKDLYDAHPELELITIVGEDLQPRLEE
jgi:hypothetical protein